MWGVLVMVMYVQGWIGYVGCVSDGDVCVRVQ